jgi:hypothetical protein
MNRSPISFVLTVVAIGLSLQTFLAHESDKVAAAERNPADATPPAALTADPT